MKRTHKFQSLGDVQKVLDAAGTIALAAKQLGVQRSSLYRWIKVGKLTAPAGTQAGEITPPGAEQTPEAWAAAVRETAMLDGTGLALLMLAEKALTMSQVEEDPKTRLSAMARFQQLVKQLSLRVAVPAAVEPSKMRATSAMRPHRADPRAMLMAVK